MSVHKCEGADLRSCTSLGHPPNPFIKPNSQQRGDDDNVEALTKQKKFKTNINQIAHIGKTTGCILEKEIKTVKDVMLVIWGQVRQLLFGTPTKELEGDTERSSEMYAGIPQED